MNGSPMMRTMVTTGCQQCARCDAVGWRPEPSEREDRQGPRLLLSRYGAV